MPIRSSFAFFLLLSVSSVVFTSCQDHKDPSIDTFGQLDSSKIAADTTMQVNLDRSYEFQKTLVKSDTEVYDFLAYDKPKGSSSPEWESKFIVIRRTSSAQDTVVKDIRAGSVQNIWVSDIDGNGKPEIMFYEYPKYGADTTHHFQFFAYETDGRKRAHKILSGIKENYLHSRGRDSFFISQNYLIRKVPYYEKQKDSIASADLWQSYRLQNGALIFEKEKKVLQ